MDMNDYVIEVLARAYVADLHASALRGHLARTARPPRTRLRVRLGHALVRLGNRLLGELAGVRATA
jgi:hypothetical protein